MKTLEIPENKKLGRLCAEGHEWNGTGQSLRYRLDGNCVECRIQYHKQRYQDNRESCRQYKKQYYQDNREIVLQRNRQHYRDNKWEYAIRNSTKKALQHKCLRLPYAAKDLDQLLETFNNECAYCGSKYGVGADHFIPLSKGGADAIYNLVPACLSCNASKNNRDPMAWMNKKVEKTRINKVLNYLEIARGTEHSTYCVSL